MDQDRLDAPVRSSGRRRLGQLIAGFTVGICAIVLAAVVAHTVFEKKPS